MVKRKNVCRCGRKRETYSSSGREHKREKMRPKDLRKNVCRCEKKIEMRSYSTSRRGDVKRKGAHSRRALL
jgi:hypothetical protein